MHKTVLLAPIWALLLLWGNTSGLSQTPVTREFMAEAQVKPVEFSRVRGFYDTVFDLWLHTDTADAQIRVTLDGSLPTATHGLVYDGPLAITGTRCVRAVAVKRGYIDSESVTHSYLFIDDITRQSLDGQRPGPDWPHNLVNGQRFEYGMDKGVVNHRTWGAQLETSLLSIPSLSVVTDLAHLFDPHTGIYVNAQQHGRDWERPTSLELIYPDTPQGPGFPDLMPVPGDTMDMQWILPEAMQGGFQINAGLRIRGGFSRSGNNPKHALRLFFRDEYGQGELKYPLFGTEGTDHFDKVDLRTAQNYSWSFSNDSANTMCREVWARDTQGHMGQPYTHSRYYHLYINGQYWGIYQTQERAEASYGAAYLGGERDDYDTVKSAGSSGGYTIEATDGTLDMWRKLWDLAKLGFSSHVNYFRAQGLDPDGTRNPDYPVLLDIDNLIDYMMVVFFDGDRDAPISNFLGNDRPNNWFGIRNRKGDLGFRFFVHDAEHTMSRGMTDRTGPYPAGDQFQYSNPQWIHQELMAHPDYRMRFADRAHTYLTGDGLLTPDRCIERLEFRAQQIDMAIIAESARWGSLSLNKTTWRNMVNHEINSFLSQRASVVLSQFQRTRLRDRTSAPLYPEVEAAAFSHSGGQLDRRASISMVAPQGTVYYTLDGTDPRLSDAASTVKLIPEQAAKRVLVPSQMLDQATWAQWTLADMDDTSWISSAGNVGFDVDNASYDGLIDLNIQDEMHQVNSSCLMRIPFTLHENQWESLTLNARYDDGFIAYLNGTEILRVNHHSRGAIRWNSRAIAERPLNLARIWESFDISEHRHLMQAGHNLLALQGLNTSVDDADFLLSATLQGKQVVHGDIAPTALAYDGPLRLQRSSQLRARVFDGAWSAMSEVTYAVGPVAQSLRITEIMYRPLDTGVPHDADAEYVELQNNGSEAIDVGLVEFLDGIRFVFPSLVLDPGEHILVVRDILAFEATYGLGHRIAGQYEGNLNDDGDQLILRDAVGQVITEMSFDGTWYSVANGQGFSLTLLEPQSAIPDAMSQKTAWRPSQFTGGSPGQAESQDVVEPRSILVNELLTHSHAEAPDWIELHNTTDQPIYVGGWLLSDDPNVPLKYELPAGQFIEAQDYLVLYEDLHFNNPNDPGTHEPFAMSENGETLCIWSASSGQPTGYFQRETFGASETGFSLGRYQKSTGTFNFVALVQPTPGAPNAGPLVGPVVISEIMYNPAGAGSAEYVELYNMSDYVVILYDYETEEPWRFTDDPDNPSIDFFFPTDAPVIMEPGQYLLLCRSAAALRSEYAVPNTTLVYEWGDGKLANGGEKIQLSKPGDVDDAGTRFWIRVDRVSYSDGSHPEGSDPWPRSTDGYGSALTRIDISDYGNDPANWWAGAPTPGSD
jgi:hypothetical protein